MPVPHALAAAPQVPRTHPDVVAAKDIEGNLVPGNIGTSVGEDEDHAVLLSHQLDCVFQGKLEGLSCVRGLSQPAQVFHRPAHKHKHSLICWKEAICALLWALGGRFSFQRRTQKADWAAFRWTHCLKSVMLLTLTPSCTTSCARSPLYCTTLTLESLPANWKEQLWLCSYTNSSQHFRAPPTPTN